jgi:hypothetical protein
MVPEEACKWEQNVGTQDDLRLSAPVVMALHFPFGATLSCAGARLERGFSCMQTQQRKPSQCTIYYSLAVIFAHIHMRSDLHYTLFFCFKELNLIL